MTTTTTRRIIVDAIANMHSHIRDGEPQRDLIYHLIAGGCDVILPMPNIGKVGLRTAQHVVDYIAHAQSLLLPADKDKMMFMPCMVVNEETPLDEIRNAYDVGVRDVKIYPLNRTTFSEFGVRNYVRLLAIVRLCGELGIRVHFHPEYPWLSISNEDAEYQFITWAEMFLRETNAVIFWEHGTDGRCIRFWEELAIEYPGRFFVTITAHHLLMNSDETFGDVRATCKPSIKGEDSRRGLVALVAKNYAWVMAGADDAPHPDDKKHVHEGKCACGDFTSPFLHGMYAHALRQLLVTESGVEIYKNFTSRNARRVFGLPPARQCVLEQKPSIIPLSYKAGPWTVESAGAGRTLDWTFVEYL